MATSTLLALVALAPAALRAQGDVCASASAPGCRAAEQALHSAYPQVGILLAAGSPLSGTDATMGVRLGRLPGVTAALRVNAVDLRLPDVLRGPDDGGEVRGVAPLVGGDVSVRVFGGVPLSPTVGGFGAVDLVGSVAWLPLSETGMDGFDESPGVAWGLGARVGVTRESFTVPAVNLSLMYRRVGGVRYGDVCRGGTRDGAGLCDDAGPDATSGEARFGVHAWSLRGTVAKRLWGLGLAGGVGYDRFTADDARFAFGTPADQGISGRVAARDGRVSLFGGAAYALPLGSLSVEAGWMAGGDGARAGFDDADHDPGRGTFWGSVGVRVGL
jgi:hypothetical protein